MPESDSVAPVAAHTPSARPLKRFDVEQSFDHGGAQCWRLLETVEAEYHSAALTAVLGGDSQLVRGTSLTLAAEKATPGMYRVVERDKYASTLTFVVGVLRVLDVSAYAEPECGPPTGDESSAGEAESC